MNTMETAVNKIDTSNNTYTLICYSTDGDLDGSCFQIYQNSLLTEEQKQLFNHWEEQNKLGHSSEDLSLRRKYEDLNSNEKKCYDMRTLLDDGKNIHDITPYLGSITRIIKFLIW